MQLRFLIIAAAAVLLSDCSGGTVLPTGTTQSANAGSAPAATARTTSSIVPPRVPHNVWNSIADMPGLGGRFGVEYAASATVNNILYVMGGAVSGNTTTNLNQAYNPVTNTWTLKAPVPDARGQGAGGSSSAGAASIGGSIYYAGGFNYSQGFHITNALRVYDPVADRWTERAPMITPRYGFAAAQLHGLLYAAGGAGGLGGSVTNVVEAYNPVLDRWTTVAPMPTARIFPAAVAVNGALYVIGGVLPNGSPQNAVEVYDPVANKWTKAPAMPTARGGIAIGAVGNTIYAVGGGVDTFPPVRLTYGLGPPIGYKNEAYDTVAKTWSERLPLPAFARRRRRWCN